MWPSEVILAATVFVVHVSLPYPYLSNIDVLSTKASVSHGTFAATRHDECAVQFLESFLLVAVARDYLLLAAVARDYLLLAAVARDYLGWWRRRANKFF